MKVLRCPKFEFEDYRSHSALCISCEASENNEPPCSIRNMCHHCEKAFLTSCPIYEKEKGAKCYEDEE